MFVDVRGELHPQRLLPNVIVPRERLQHDGELVEVVSDNGFTDDVRARKVVLDRRDALRVARAGEALEVVLQRLRAQAVCEV
jgi:hypothetical protein